MTDRSCQIGTIGAVCHGCGRHVMAHSICPQTGERATPLTAEEKAAVLIAAARQNPGGLVTALMSGRWPSGQPVGTAESVTVCRYDGEYVEGMEPVEVIRAKVVDGELVVEPVEDNGG